jgi:hypothetical protein
MEFFYVGGIQNQYKKSGRSRVNKLLNNLPYLVHPNSFPFFVLSIAFVHRISSLTNVVGEIKPYDARFRKVIEMYTKTWVYYTVSCPVSVKDIRNI